MQTHHTTFSAEANGTHHGGALVALALLACYLIWGSTYFAISVALPSFPPFFQMGTRFLAASALLFLWALIRHMPWPNWRQWRDAAIAGILMIGCGMGLLACAEQYIHSALAAAMTMLEPLLICLLSLVLGWRACRREFIGIGIGMIGILLLTSQNSFQAQPLGLLFMLGSVVSWSIGSVLVAKWLRPAPGSMGLACQMFCGALVLLLISGMAGEAPQMPTTNAWLAWSYLVLAGSLGAYVAYIYLVKNTSPAIYTSYNYVTPVIALLIGSFWGNEPVTWTEIAAMGICLCGIVLLLSPKRQK